MQMSHRLTRRDPTQNMARFYRLSLEPAFLGDWALVRHWGRIGTQGQRSLQLFASQPAAEAAVTRALAAKCRRGYAEAEAG
jgi:predicted DNA-binding WGR domain protein